MPLVEETEAAAGETGRLKSLIFEYSLAPPALGTSVPPEHCEDAGLGAGRGQATRGRQQGALAIWPRAPPRAPQARRGLVGARKHLGKGLRAVSPLPPTPSTRLPSRARGRRCGSLRCGAPTHPSTFSPGLTRGGRRDQSEPTVLNSGALTGSEGGVPPPPRPSSPCAPTLPLLPGSLPESGRPRTLL